MTTRNPCRNHPDREGRVFCQKYSRWYCEDCVQCFQPKQYCKFRTACLVWEFEKYGIPDDFKNDEENSAEKEETPPAGRALSG